MKLIDENRHIFVNDIPELMDNQFYIYIIQNNEGHIKIGRTKNIAGRIQSLQGSNSGVHTITRVFVSESTYLYSLEETMHNHFYSYRVPGTEWFYQKKNEPDLFIRAVGYLLAQFNKDGYQLCNQTRKAFIDKTGIVVCK